MHSYNTRIFNNYYIRRINTSFGHRSLSYQGPALWGSVPNEIKNSLGFKKAKTAIYDLLASKL